MYSISERLKMSRIVSTFFTIAVLIALVLYLPSCGSQEGRLKVATTTSLYDTGLWDYLGPQFENEYGVKLDVIYAGTGKALEWGMRGDVDVIAVHSKPREEQFVSEGYGAERLPFAYNYFILVGPESDPAGVSDMSPEEAFARLISEGTGDADNIKFVSRGDDSGTNSKERTLWAGAGYNYEDVRTSGPWYIEAGSGMGPTLKMASEMRAYTLTDIGTFMAYESDLELVPLVEKGEQFLNVYSAIVVDGSSNEAMANNLVDWITSERIQDMIGEYGVPDYGKPLFIPCAGQEM
jgi:tungstate transport system substrate-binding protein